MTEDAIATRLLPPAPRRLPSAMPAEAAPTATTIAAFTLHYCGLLGSPAFAREIPIGTRFEVLEHDPVGLVRVRAPELDIERALVDVEHFDLTGLDLDALRRPDPARHFDPDDDEEPCPTDSNRRKPGACAPDTPPRCASSTPAGSSTNDGSCSSSSSSARLTSTPPPTRPKLKPNPRAQVAALAAQLLAGEPVEIRHLPDIRRRLELNGDATGALELDLDIAAGTARLVRKEP